MSDVTRHKLRLRGAHASIVWGYHTAAVVSNWRVRRGEGAEWILAASIVRADRLKLKQKELLFSAPRKGGFFTWPVLAVLATDTAITARLGPPEL